MEQQPRAGARVRWSRGYLEAAVGGVAGALAFGYVGNAIGTRLAPASVPIYHELWLGGLYGALLLAPLGAALLSGIALRLFRRGRALATGLLTVPGVALFRLLVARIFPPMGGWG